MEIVVEASRKEGWDCGVPSGLGPSLLASAVAPQAAHGPVSSQFAPSSQKLLLSPG